MREGRHCKYEDSSPSISSTENFGKDLLFVCVCVKINMHMIWCRMKKKKMSPILKLKPRFLINATVFCAPGSPREWICRL